MTDKKPRGNPFRWLAGGEFRKTPAELVDETVSSPRTGPRPRIKKKVKKKDPVYTSEQLVDAETIKTPYGDVQGIPGDWVVWFEGNAQVLKDADYRANFDEVPNA